MLHGLRRCEEPSFKRGRVGVLVRDFLSFIENSLDGDDHPG